MTKPTYEELQQRVKELEKEAVEHKRAKEELQTILNVVPVMIFQKDRDGKTIRTNQAFDTMIGLSKEEIIGKTTDELFPEHGKDMIKDDQEVMELGKQKLDIIEHYDSPEETRWARTGKVPIKDKEGNVVGLIGYAADITEQKQAEEALREKTRDLGERVKELNCLYNISHVVEKPDISLEETLQKTVDLIPLSWQYPEITCVRLILQDQTFTTDNFNETVWKQASDIMVHGERIGTLEVIYLEERPGSDEGPFQKEERSLINAIGERLGKVIERKQAEVALKQERDKLQDALARVKILSGLLPICANCKKIRDDKGYWNQIEAYIRDHSEADFSHSICPECAKNFYPEFYKGDEISR
jgi:PAS domain S-box-containing protein